MILEDRLTTVKREYPILWQEIVKDWDKSKSADALWLTYAANYLVATGDVHWAIDPFSLSTRIPGVVEPDFANDLKNLNFVVLTHAHNDHLDLNLIHALRHSSIKWVIPEHTLPKILEKTSLDPNNIIIPQNRQTFTIDKVFIQPFDSLHFHNLGGIAETGYLFEFNGKRWLFPGDVRNYDISKMPTFNNLDGVFAHLWLGKGHAKDSRPPLLHDFVNFYKALAPARIVISHLDEFGRSREELWDESHYMKAARAIHTISPSIHVKMAKMGMKITL